MTTINPAHRYAVYEYNDRVTDSYYRGKRFISANGLTDERTIIVATADTVEECQSHIPEIDLREWMLHSLLSIGMPREAYSLPVKGSWGKL